MNPPDPFSAYRTKHTPHSYRIGRSVKVTGEDIIAEEPQTAAASLMISGGADVATVSGLLGHSQVSTFLRSSEKSGVSHSETGVFNSQRFSVLTA